MTTTQLITRTYRVDDVETGTKGTVLGAGAGKDGTIVRNIYAETWLRVPVGANGSHDDFLLHGNEEIAISEWHRVCGGIPSREYTCTTIVTREGRYYCQSCSDAIESDRQKWLDSDGRWAR